VIWCQLKCSFIWNRRPIT